MTGSKYSPDTPEENEQKIDRREAVERLINKTAEKLFRCTYDTDFYTIVREAFEELESL